MLAIFLNPHVRGGDYCGIAGMLGQWEIGWARSLALLCMAESVFCLLGRGLGVMYSTPRLVGIVHRFLENVS